MKRIFYREGQDEDSLNSYLNKHRIEQDESTIPSIRIDYQDWFAKYYLATNGNYYKEFYFCGYEEYLYQFDSEEEFKADLTNVLVNRCNLKLLSNSTT